MDDFSAYNQIKMDLLDAEKTVFSETHETLEPSGNIVSSITISKAPLVLGLVQFTPTKTFEGSSNRCV